MDTTQNTYPETPLVKQADALVDQATALQNIGKYDEAFLLLTQADELLCRADALIAA